jgi:hypothetical protein
MKAGIVGQIPFTTIEWAHYKAVLHDSIGALEISVSKRCPICTLILSSVPGDKQTKLRQGCMILLGVGRSDDVTVLHTLVKDHHGHDILPKEDIALCSGLLEPGTLVCADECFVI